MQTLSLIVSLATLVAVAFLFYSTKKPSTGGAEEIKDSLQKNATDLAQRITEASGQTKLELTKEISGSFQTMQEKVGEQLKSGREEQGKSLADVTEKLENKFSKLQETNQQQMEAIRAKVEGQLSSIGEKVQSKLDENIREGFKHFDEVQKSLKAAEAQLLGVSTVGNSINELNNLLKLPHLRGKFGEATLDRLLNDLLPNHLIERNANIPGAGQVEFLIKFAKAKIPLDSKFPREQVAPLFEVDSDPVRLTEARKKLSEVIRAESNRIAKYIVPDFGTTMALMFLPSETLYFEVIRDEKGCDDLYKKKVFPVSPNTLAISLKGISIANDYYEMSKGVDKTIEELQKTKKHFGNFQSQFDKIGDSLTKAEESYRVAQGHLGKYSGSVARLTGSAMEESSGSIEGGTEQSKLPNT